MSEIYWWIGGYAAGTLVAYHALILYFDDTDTSDPFQCGMAAALWPVFIPLSLIIAVFIYSVIGFMHCMYRYRIWFTSKPWRRNHDR